MKPHHYVEDGELIKAAQSAVVGDVDKKAVGASIERYLGRQPVAPALVGATEAARLLKVQPPHIARLKEQGRMPEAVEIEGSHDAYLREEVVELAVELAAERRERKRKRDARARSETKA